MHFLVLALIPKETSPDDVEAVVDHVLAPSIDEYWDWWQIGGRWTGALTGYDPTRAVTNMIQCRICGGSGERQGGAECPNCEGRGWETNWPTEWERYPGDVQPVASVPPDFTASAIVTPDGVWHECTIPDEIRWSEMGEEIAAQAKGEKYQPPPALVTARQEWRQAFHAILQQHPNTLAVIVDCHN